MITVRQAISQCTELLGSMGVGKDGYNKDQKFSFRRVEDVIGAVNMALVKTKLVITPTDTKIHSIERFTTKSGTPMVLATIVQGYYVTIDGHKQDESDSIAIEVAAQGADMLDKAIAKAMSSAYKYAMGQLFHIPFEALDIEDEGGADAVTLADAEDALLSSAKEAASKGLKAYQVFYTEVLKPEERKLLREHHDSLKAAAKKVTDSENGDMMPPAEAPDAIPAADLPEAGAEEQKKPARRSRS